MTQSTRGKKDVTVKYSFVHATLAKQTIIAAFSGNQFEDRDHCEQPDNHKEILSGLSEQPDTACYEVAEDRIDSHV